MSWKKVKLGEVIKQRKDFIIIDNSVEYKRCRVQVNRKGVILRDIVKGIAINTKKQQVCKEGDFLVAEIDAKVGGYGFIGKDLEGAIVSSHYFLFEVDETKLLKKYLSWLIKTDIIQEQITSKGSTNYAAIRPSHVLNFEIPLPSISEQLEIVNRLNNINTRYSLLSKELNHQLTYLQQLRQSILQEAVQGKLSEQNASDEDAATLLKRIKAEKQKLIKEGKLKKEKELPPITDDEIPFELRKGWVWCRLGDCGITQTGATPPTNKKENFGNFIPFLGPADLNDGEVNYNNSGLSKIGLEKGRLIPKDSILMVCIGGSIGKCRIVNQEVSCNQQINTITCSTNILYAYAFISLTSPYFQNEVLSKASGSATPIINKGKWENIIIPLPPFSEQQRIVAKVQQLQQQLSQLEAQVQQSRQYAEQLLQSVLREAFLEKGKVYEMGEEKAWMVAEE
jgi:type I restriction enzyme S subunit